MAKRKLKEISAYAIVHSGNEIDCFDERVPLYWYKKVAIAALKENSFSDSRIVKVVVKEARHA